MQGVSEVMGICAHRQRNYLASVRQQCYDRIHLVVPQLGIMDSLLLTISILLVASAVSHQVNCSTSDSLGREAPVRRFILDSSDDTRADDDGQSFTGQAWPRSSPLSAGKNRPAKTREEQEISPTIDYNPIRNFVVLVVFRRHGINLTSSCHGTILSDRLVLFPSVCLGNIRGNSPITTIAVMNATLTKPLDEEEEPFPVGVGANIKPNYELLSKASHLCVSGGMDAPTKVGHLSVVRLKNPLRSFERIERAKAESGRTDGPLKLCSLNTTRVHNWAAVRATNCPRKITDKTIACFEKDARAYSILDSPWNHLSGICHSKYTQPANAFQQLCSRANTDSDFACRKYRRTDCRRKGGQAHTLRDLGEAAEALL